MNKSASILVRNVSIIVGILIITIGLVFLSRDITPPTREIVKTIDISKNK